MYAIDLNYPIYLMHHVLVTYCIYFVGIAFICDTGTVRLSDICSVRKGYTPITTQALDGPVGKCPGGIIHVLGISVVVFFPLQFV